MILPIDPFRNIFWVRFGKEVLIEAHLCPGSVGGRNPVNRTLNLTPALSCSAFGFGIEGAMHGGDFTRLGILINIDVLNYIGVTQTHFPPGDETEKLLRWVLAKIILLDV